MFCYLQPGEERKSYVVSYTYLTKAGFDFNKKCIAYSRRCTFNILSFVDAQLSRVLIPCDIVDFKLFAIVIYEEVAEVAIIGLVTDISAIGNVCIIDVPVD